MRSPGKSLEEVEPSVARPDEVIDLLIAALARGDNAAIPRLLCRDVCFLTQDATAIYGRDRVASLIAQLVAAGVDVCSLAQSSLQIGSIAMVSARWRLSFRAREEPLVQTTEATLVLADREGSWKHLLVAPWGCPRCR
ncbi:MAG TPA: nuclear transport factor 2 family protein [Solirubrobacterales bacterium]|nr:nuclear transport factor 2 family protein [Solirubrobacterales bacterium]